jgi:antitoxin component YwqK of YwqJK toxin-antitoxin module
MKITELIKKLKNRIILLLLISCGVSTLFAQENVPRNGFVKFYYPSGQLASEGTMRDGQPDGYWVTYYPTGIKKSEGKRDNFLLDSIWTFYDNKGDTLQKISYMLGKKNGYYLIYGYEGLKEGRDHGVIISRELYVNDKREGLSYYYYDDGKLQYVVGYLDGKKQGLSKEYDKDGTIRSLVYYHNGLMTEREDINRVDANGLKQGVWKEFFPDGKLKSEKSYHNGMLDGLFKEFNEKGNLVMVLKYNEGQVVAEDVDEEENIEIRNEYDERNRLLKSGPYRENVPIGIHRQYNARGEVIASQTYDNKGNKIAEGIVDEEGRKQGKWNDYYPGGKMMTEGQYQDNYRTGKWNFYRKNGRIEQTGEYNLGRPHGLWVWYYEEGSVLREEEFFNGREDGKLVEYAFDGSIITEGDYVDGEKEGPWYYREGDHIEIGSYITGLRDGKWKYFYGDSTLEFEGYFIQGDPDGKQKLFYQNGNLKEERFYVMGIKERNWKKYDESGNLVMTITYKNDEEARVNGVKVDLPEGSRVLIQ